jgi:hypothetical protein
MITFSHSMVGVGFPSTGQCSTELCPFMTVGAKSKLVASIEGASKNTKHNKNYELLGIISRKEICKMTTEQTNCNPFFLC